MRYFLCLFLFSQCCFADPFYAETPNKSAKQPAHFADFSQDLTPCKPKAEVENVYFPFNIEQFKLVGIVNIKQQFRALFLDKQNKLIELKENDFVVSTQIQVKKIDLKKVIFIDWKNSPICHEPHKIQLTL